MENNTIKTCRKMLEARIPSSMRSPDWEQRWAEWELFMDMPVELKQMTYSGKPMIEEIWQAFSNGNLRADECLALINRHYVGVTGSHSQREKRCD